MANPTVVGQITPETTEAGSEKSRSKLTKALPTDRLSYEKQLLVLRCFAIGASGDSSKPVQNGELAKLSSVGTASVGLNNTFFADAGLITKIGLGYVPSAEVVSYERAYQFNQETAGQKLAPALRRSWAGVALVPKLGARPMGEEEALGELAAACNAGPEHKPQLRTLLEYLALASLVERDGTMVRQGRLARDDGPAARPAADSVPSPQEPATPPGVQRAVSTSFAANPNAGAAGGLNLAVNIQVDMAEMGTWPPQVVSAFMAGLAQVITAKAAAEASASR